MNHSAPRELAVWLVVLSLMVSGVCWASTTPHIGDEVELLLGSGRVVRGTLLEIDSQQVLVMRSGFLPAKVEISSSEISGIRRPGDAEFRPFSPKELAQPSEGSMPLVSETTRVIRVKSYDNLPLMAVAIAGGVFAGDRLAKASSEHDVADSLEKLGLHDDAKDYESRASAHTGQALLGIAIVELGVYLASRPSYEEIPLEVMVPPAADLGAVRVALDLTRLPAIARGSAR